MKAGNAGRVWQAVALAIALVLVHSFVGYLAAALLRLFHPAAFNVFAGGRAYYLLHVYFDGFFLIAYSLLIYGVLWWGDRQRRLP